MNRSSDKTHDEALRLSKITAYGYHQCMHRLRESQRTGHHLVLVNGELKLVDPHAVKLGVSRMPDHPVGDATYPGQ